MGSPNELKYRAFFRRCVNNPACSWDLQTFAKLYLKCGEKMRIRLEIPAAKIYEDYKNTVPKGDSYG